MPTIRFEQWPGAIEVRRGTILDAALAAGIPYPHGCRSGDCGSCKSRLIAGDVARDPCAPEALSREEECRGLFLACRARPKSDVQVAWVAQAACNSLPIKTRTAEVVGLESATHDIKRVRLRAIGAKLEFYAGQYVELRCNGCPPRPYSMANRPDEDELELHVRRVPGGKVSGYVAARLRLGERVSVEGPFGSAHLRPGHDGPLLLLAGGSGLAPIKSILRTVLARGHGHPLHLYHGVRDARDLYDVEELAQLAASGLVSFQRVLSNPESQGAYRRGFVHEVLAADFASLSGFEVYVAGPPPMVDAVRKTVLGLGVTPEHVYADAFHASPSDERHESAGFLRRMGRMLQSRGAL
jgi:CDP-4-dehydro-6-deoxyglucose reductase/ferredoxin-NAD(P)+ reductase (naphthalene dioxygenase ferredoxin-specific)